MATISHARPRMAAPRRDLCDAGNPDGACAHRPALAAAGRARAGRPLPQGAAR